MKQLISIATPDIADQIVDLKNNHSEYAKVHGYDYKCYSDLHWPDLAASFSKIWAVKEALDNDHNEFVIWADIDVVFIDMTVDLAALLQPDYWLAAYQQQNLTEWRYLCAGLMIIRNGIQARAWVDWMVKKIDTKEVTWHPWEQWYFDQYNRDIHYAGIHACSAQEIGCFSREYWNDGVIWTPDCPTVHIGGQGTSWAQRRDVFIQSYAPLIKRP